MHVVMAAAEAIPFAKTGGLADVCGTLPLKLAEQGHRCSIFIPAYKRALECGLPMVDTHISFVVDMVGRPMAARILKTTLGNGSVDVYLVDQPLYFDRDQLYGFASFLAAWWRPSSDFGCRLTSFIAMIGKRV